MDRHSDRYFHCTPQLRCSSHRKSVEHLARRGAVHRQPSTAKRNIPIGGSGARGEARLGDALQSSLANAFAAYGFNLVGDISKNRFAEGGITKIGLHALMGGLAAEASGGDFRTGALAAGVNEALLDSLAKNYADMPDDQKKVCWS